MKTSNHILWLARGIITIFFLLNYWTTVLPIAVITCVVLLIWNKKFIVTWVKKAYPDWDDKPGVAVADKIIPKFRTYVAGVALCATFAGVLAFWLTSLLPLFSYFIPLFIIIFAVFIAQIFVGGLEEVKVGQRAVILFLGEPIPGPWVLGTGWNWIWKPLFTVEHVSTSEQILNIPLTAEDKGFEVTTLAKASAADTDSSKDTGGQMELLVRLAVRYKVFSSKTFIIFDEGKAGEKVRDGIRNIAVSSVRAQAATMTDEEFMADKEKVATKIATDLDITSHNFWGIDTLKGIISKAEIANPKSKEARESATNEKRHRQAEVIGMEHVVNITNIVTEGLIKAGMPKEKAVEEANRIVARERSKATQFFFGDKDPGDFTKGAAIAASVPSKTT